VPLLDNPFLQDMNVPSWFTGMLEVRNKQISTYTNKLQQLERAKQQAEGHLKVSHLACAMQHGLAAGRIIPRAHTRLHHCECAKKYLATVGPILLYSTM
jgi:hypothetical protein